MKLMLLPLVAVVLIAGCSAQHTTPAAAPAATSHRLTLGPGDVATADVTAYAIDTATGNACPRWGNLVVTPPNDFVSHPLSVDVPICSATVSSVD